MGRQAQPLAYLPSPHLAPVGRRHSAQGDALSRMDRKGAARTYHTFVYAGYFNRHMKQRAQERHTHAEEPQLSPLLTSVFCPEAGGSSAPEEGRGSRSSGLPGPAKRFHLDSEDESSSQPVQSGYGEVAPVWRFFEHVRPGLTLC